MNSIDYRKALLLDFDGVILDSERLYLRLIQLYNKKCGIQFSDEFYITHLLGTSKDVISDIIERETGYSIDWTEYWDGLIKYREDFVRENHVDVKEGFFELMHRLKKNEYLVGIVSSNSHLLMNSLLCNAGIDTQIFNFIIAREDVKRLKPYPDLYEKAASICGIPKDRIFAIEDSEPGITAASNAGVNVVYIKDIAVVSEESRKKCFAYGDSLTDVIDFLNI